MAYSHICFLAFLQPVSGVGDIFEVSWNDGEDRVAACFSTNVVAVIDLRM